MANPTVFCIFCVLASLNLHVQRSVTAVQSIYSFSQFDISSDKVLVQEYVAKFNNHKQRRLIYEQVRHCPYRDLCAFSLGKTLPTFSPIENNCCWKCRCDTECGIFTDCCPDIVPEEYFANDTDSLTDVVCIPTSIKLEVTKGVTGISSCQKDTPADISSECHHTDAWYNEDNIYDYLPVTDSYTNITYKNKYCAMCNGVTGETLSTWVVYIRCETLYDYVKLSSESDLITGVYKSQSCNINYKSRLYDTSNCLMLQSKCNSTGMWHKRDEFEEWACSTYISPVQADDGVIYKNVFCALCNGFSGIRDKCHSEGDGIELQSFSALFSVKDQIARIPTSCPAGHIRTPGGSCVKAHCSIFRRLKNNVCEPLFKYAGGINYKFSMRVFPLSNLSLMEGFNIAPRIVNFLEKYILAPTTPNQPNGYQLFVVCSPDTLTEQITDNAKVQYFDITLMSWFTVLHNPDDIRQRFIQTRNNKVFGINNEARRIVFFKSLVRDDSGKETKLAKQRVNDYYSGAIDSLFITVAGHHSSGLPMLELAKAVARFNSFSRTFTVPFLTKHAKVENIFTNQGELSVLKCSECPLVSVFVNNAQWHETSTGLVFKHINVSVDLSEFTYSDSSMDTINVCSDIYFKLQTTSGGNVLSLHQQSVLAVVSGYLVSTLMFK